MAELGSVEILDNIPLNLDIAKISKFMRLHGDTKRVEENLRSLIEMVIPIARPKAVYKTSCVDQKNCDSLEIDGIKFTSRLLRDTLEKVAVVFPCVATCGTEVEAISISDGDIMKRYCLDVIKTHILFSAANYFREYLTGRYGLTELSSLNPGELASFPSSQHKNLFSLLGDVTGMIGVELTKNCALIPTKSHSGIYFSAETKFISCRMCTQRRCQGRRAPYDAELAKPYQTR